MIENWGTAPDGSAVQRVILRREGLSASVISFGAVLQNLFLDGHAPSLVLGLEQLERYFKDSNCFGATVGRYANRIKNGRFDLDGQTYHLDKNQDGNHTLHGGTNNTTFRNWTIADHGPDFVELTDVLPDGHMGFPGELRATARYWIDDNQTLGFSVAASTDASTICNFTCHNYFNLDGTPTIESHLLQVNATKYLPVDPDGIPVNGAVDVAKTHFDFRKFQPLARAGQITMLDHNFCLSNAQVALRPVAKMRSTMSDIEIEISTTEPGLQVYTGAKINKHLANPTPFAGIALEPQNWPDAPNNPSFPSAVLRPDQIYFHESKFQIR